MFQDADLKSLYQSLLSILKKEIEVYEELHTTMVHERKVLARPSIDELCESNSKKETCILKARMLDEARMSLMRKIAGLCNIGKEDVNISTLLSYAGDSHRRELKESQSALRSLIMSLSEFNEGNKTLINSSLFYVRNSIDFINNLISPSSTYMNTGQMNMGKVSGKMVYTEG